MKKKNLYLLFELGCSSVSYVNGNKVQGKDLNSGDILKIGVTQFVFTSIGLRN